MSGSYGTDVASVSQAFEKHVGFGDDPSHDALVLIALAYAAVRRLEKEEGDLVLNGRPLVYPALERAYREVLHVRRTKSSDNFVDVNISRFGRLKNAKPKIPYSFE